MPEKSDHGSEVLPTNVSANPWDEGSPSPAEQVAGKRAVSDPVARRAQQLAILKMEVARLCSEVAELKRKTKDHRTVRGLGPK